MKKLPRLLCMTILIALFGIPKYGMAQEKMDTVNVIDITNKTKVFMSASFPGGLDGWRKYLMENLRYPKKAAKKNIMGTVKVQMLVDENGKVKEAKALNDPGGGLAAEATRVIKEGPDWIPAEQNGKKVSSQFVQNIIFEIQ
jgi:periplasmic protein TonB